MKLKYGVEKRQNQKLKKIMLDRTEYLKLVFSVLKFLCCQCVCECESLGRVRLFVTPRTVALQAPLSMGFSRQKYWSGLPFPSPLYCQRRAEILLYVRICFMSIVKSQGQSLQKQKLEKKQPIRKLTRSNFFERRKRKTQMKVEKQKHLEDRNQYVFISSR